MGNEEKIYALMAHAEDLQAHAASLQNKNLSINNID